MFAAGHPLRFAANNLHTATRQTEAARHEFERINVLSGPAALQETISGEIANEHGGADQTCAWSSQAKLIQSFKHSNSPKRRILFE